jgi:hypothetical protein
MHWSHCANQHVFHVWRSSNIFTFLRFLLLSDVGSGLAQYGRILRRAALILTLVMVLVWGCSQESKELNLASYGSSVDQRLIADYYLQEARRFRQQADELDARIEMYEQMFGHGSDWVSGTRLLAESYRHVAEERERLARRHLEVIHPSTE